MAEFIGTSKEFQKFLGGYCRNKVLSITLKEKKNHNKTCEYCGAICELQSAHRKGQERTKIINEILESNFLDNKNIFRVNLEKFEKLFIDAHKPIEDQFYFLCQDCHRSYDNGKIDDCQIIKQKMKSCYEQLSKLAKSKTDK